MSYRAPEQALEEPIDKILNGIAEYDAAVDKRIESGEWKKDHCDEIADISLALRRIAMRLRKVKAHTW